MKRKNKIRVMMAALLMLCFMAGCADRAGANVAGTTETVETRSDQTAAEERTDAPECPEGYVYDYQVSMEPIPEEIAALGGPCQGTIHAFPSRIGMALTELEMEKDPVLKAEVEKRIPEIEAALEEEIGGEFVVDGVILSDDLSWVFFCTEVATGYQFDLYYANNEYYAQINGKMALSNDIYLADYFDEKESFAVREDLLSVLDEIYGDGSFMIRSQSGVGTIDIVIVQYTDEIIDKQLEQDRLLQLWEQLKIYNADLYYNINLSFFPLEYRSVIDEKMTTTIRYDFSRFYSEEAMRCLIDNGELWCCLRYSVFSHHEDLENLDILLQQYKNGDYNKEIVWDYWIP